MGMEPLWGEIEMKIVIVLASMVVKDLKASTSTFESRLTMSRSHTARRLLCCVINVTGGNGSKRSHPAARFERGDVHDVSRQSAAGIGCNRLHGFVRCGSVLCRVVLPKRYLDDRGRICFAEDR